LLDENAMQDIIDRLDKINQVTPEAELLDLLNKIAANPNDPGLRGHLSNMLKNERESHQCSINVLAAGLFGICLGGKYMLADHEGGYRVNPFLHNLRKAMIACAPLREKMKENAGTYIFYTEFYESLWNTRKRIAALARAHTGIEMGNDLLTVLYSLGGYFSNVETNIGLRDAKKSGGTTCVMTARAAYHAAGLQMFGDKAPVVGTPGGPQLELGIPVQKVANSGKKYAEASMLRDDQYAFGGKGFDDNNANEANRPQLEVGDIYYIDGEGDFRFLLRAGGAVAAHVGVVVDSFGGKAVSTVDGGAGNGTRIDLRLNRNVKFAKNLGWTLDSPDKSFSTDNIAGVDTYMADFKTEDSVLQWLKQHPREGRNLQMQIDRYDIDIKRLAAQPKIVSQLVTGRAASIENARRLIRQMKKDEKTIGQDRVLKGWWKPERYPDLKYCPRETIQAWLAA
jgi:hypothetical protein